MHSNKRLIRQSFPICKWNAWYVHGVAREQASKEERLFDGNQAIQADQRCRRFQTVSDFAEITCTKPEKSLLAPLPKKAIEQSLQNLKAVTYDGQPILK